MVSKQADRKEARRMKASKEEMMSLAQELGFSHFGILKTNDLVFMPEVRKMCEDNRCNMYNKSWGCPPACGTLEEISKQAMGYLHGIVLQMTGDMEDDFDVETMMETEKLQKERFAQMVEQLLSKEIECLPMASGACTLCQQCTYPNEPCRFPDKVHPSMEAYGLMVSDSCKAAGLEYYYGPQTITFSACILF